MKKYKAIISWKGESNNFLKGTYSRKHYWSFDGGLSVPASASPQIVPHPYSDAASIDPEEAFVASVSSCHMLWFLSIASEKGYKVESYTDNAVGYMSVDRDPGFISQIMLKPDIVFEPEYEPDADKLQEMHREAHKKCFIANSIKSEVIIEYN